MVDQEQVSPMKERNVGLKFATGVFARFLFTLPVCWLLYQIVFAITRCFVLALAPGNCAKLVLIGPFLSIFPPIIHDEDPPITTPYLSILAVALAISIGWTLISDVRRSGHPKTTRK